jgi:hypothetical protein
MDITQDRQAAGNPGSSDGPALRFLRGLRDSGQPVFHWGPGRDADAFARELADEIACSPAVGEFLADWFAEAREEWPGSPPRFQAAAARRGAHLLVMACWAHLNRNADAATVQAWLGGEPVVPDPDARASADLCLRHLPDLFRLALAHSPQDPLLDELRRLAAAHPLASPGIPAGEEAAEEPDPAAARVQLDRLLARRDLERLARPVHASAARAALGAHAETLFPGLTTVWSGAAAPPHPAPPHE